MNEIGSTHAAKGRLLLAMGIFGTIGLFVRWIPLPSSVIALVRGAIGALFVLAAALLRKTPPSLPDIRRNLALLAVSGACIGANWILLFEAYRRTTVATATLCYYLAPVFVTFLSPLVLGERLTRVKAVCAVTALIGMGFVSGVPKSGLPGGDAAAGILFGTGAAVLYACVVLMNKRLSGVSASDTTLVQLGTAALVLLPYTLLTAPAAESVSARAVLLLLFVGVVHTGAAYTLYFGAIRALPAQTVAIFSYVDPVVAILLSALLLRERMDAWSVLGAVLILGSTLVSELAGHKKQAAADLPQEEPRP